MKTPVQQPAAGSLVAAGTLLIVLSPWITARFHRLVHWLDGGIVLAVSENELFVRSIFMMLVGFVTVLTGFHLWEMGRNRNA